jgi:antitoxin VapB
LEYIFCIYGLVMKITKLFQNGSSQAVRIPKEYRFDVTEVRIRKQGRMVIIEPVEEGWEWLALIDQPDDDFVAAALDKPEEQERPELGLFK